MKFYHLTNCNRTLTLDGLAFNFAPYEQTGSWMGVYATEKEDEVKALDAAVAHGKKSVTEINAKEYANCIKKKASTSNSYISSLANTTPTPGAPVVVSVRQSVEDTEPAAQNQERVEQLEKGSDALDVVPIRKGGPAKK